MPPCFLSVRHFFGENSPGAPKFRPVGLYEYFSAERARKRSQHSITNPFAKRAIGSSRRTESGARTDRRHGDENRSQGTRPTNHVGGPRARRGRTVEPSGIAHIPPRPRALRHTPRVLRGWRTCSTRFMCGSHPHGRGLGGCERQTAGVLPYPSWLGSESKSGEPGSGNV